MSSLPQIQRVAAYAVVVRVRHEVGEPEVLLSRLSARVTPDELWTLPGGGVEHGEDPRDAVVREVQEETGLAVTVGEKVRVQSAHWPDTWRGGRRVDAQALRLVHEGWVAPDSPEPHTVEVDGSTMDAAWHLVSDITSGRVPVLEAVTLALAAYHPVRRQRLAVYGLAVRDEHVLLTRISTRGHHAGAWTLPGGGLDHGESPVVALAREVAEECGATAQVGALLGVHDVHFTGTAPNGRLEDFHGVHLLHDLTLAPDAEPHVAETDGTTDAVAWVPLAQVEQGEVEVLDVVRAALKFRHDR